MNPVRMETETQKMKRVCVNYTDGCVRANQTIHSNRVMLAHAHYCDDNANGTAEKTRLE